jgi:hypothetical protein
MSKVTIDIQGGATVHLNNGEADEIIEILKGMVGDEGLNDPNTDIELTASTRVMKSPNGVTIQI